MPYKRRSQFSGRFLSPDFGAFHAKRDFFNISNDAGAVKDSVLFFLKSGHTSPFSGICTACFGRVITFFVDFFSPTDSSGPLASSQWWRNPPDISSVIFDHDVLCKLPSRWGGGWPIQSTRSLLAQDHC